MAAGGLGTVRLKVTPAQLVNKAAEVSNEIKAMTSAFDELELLVDRTAHYWIGDAGNLHRELYAEDKKDIDIMLRRLKEHPADLLRMAQVYEEAERNVTELSNELPDDVII